MEGVGSNLGDCKDSPLYRGGCLQRDSKAHVFLWLRIHRKCNRRGEIRGSHDGDRYCSFEQVSFSLSNPLAGTV